MSDRAPPSPSSTGNENQELTAALTGILKALLDVTARLDDNATRLSAIEAKVSATQPEPAVPVLDLNLAAVPDAVLPPLWVPADKHREPMAMARAHDTGGGLTSRAGLDRKAGPLDTAVTTMVLAANPGIAVRRVTDATSDVTRTAESQELTAFIERLDGSIATILTTVAPATPTTKNSNDDAQSQLLQFEDDVQQRWNEILLDSDETDDGLCEWAKLSWQDRLRIVAEYVTTAHSQENGQKEKEKKKKKNEQEQEQEQTPFTCPVTEADIKLAKSVLSATAEQPKKQQTNLTRQSVPFENEKLRERSRLSTPGGTHASMFEDYWKDAEDNGGLSSVPQKKWLWTDDDDRMCFDLLPTHHGMHHKPNTIRLLLEFTTFSLIILSIVQLILKSYHQDDDDTKLEIVSDLVFTVWFSVEYALRWSAVRPAKEIERPYGQRDFWVAKWKWMVSFVPLIDLISVSQFYVEWVLVSLGIDSHATNSFVILRLMRILKMGKFVHNQRTISDFFSAMRKVLGDLILFLLVLLVYLVLAASAMFFLERNHEQGDMFDSIPKSMWWAVMTVTTVGYGDAYPVTDWGYVVASLTAIFGTLMMNVPLAFILNAFDEVYNNRKKREMRAAAIADKVFQWMDRHRLKSNEANHHAMGPVILKSDTDDQDPVEEILVEEILRSYVYVDAPGPRKKKRGAVQVEAQSEDKKRRLALTQFGGRVKEHKRRVMVKEDRLRAHRKKKLMKAVLKAQKIRAPILSKTTVTQELQHNRTLRDMTEKKTEAKLGQAPTPAGVVGQVAVKPTIATSQVTMV